ncbi:MAG: hypothetical protein EBU66_15010 [Bacteroidetes bacterium]|nr:hypothetical protein [bacterium]NBP65955.1 hypothetical protein [Bacteroidota bacterium]
MNFLREDDLDFLRCDLVLDPPFAFRKVPEPGKRVDEKVGLPLNLSFSNCLRLISIVCCFSFSRHPCLSAKFFLFLQFSRVKSVEDAVEELEGGVEELEGGIKELEGGVEELEGGLKKLEGGIEEIKGGVEGLEGLEDAVEGLEDLFEHDLSLILCKAFTTFITESAYTRQPDLSSIKYR